MASVKLATFTPEWLIDAPAATKILPRAYCDSKQRDAAVRAAAQRPINPDVLASLRANTDAQKANIAKLSEGGVCVVTGQQAGLFGGPLYTIYKAAAAIVNARALEAETGVPCAPIFWLQNEDHDYAEIDHCQVLDQTGALVRLQVAGPDDNRRISARTLGDGVEAACAELLDALGTQSEAESVMDVLGAHYVSEASPDTAFRGLVEHWFAEHGLLILDPSDPSLRAAAAPIHKRAIEEASTISETLRLHASAMEAAGFVVQVHVRPDAPLSFFHPEGPDGPRFRVEPFEDGYVLCGSDPKPVSRDALEGALATGGLSTSALLRPILQDTWLPTAAYVGGPGEIAYFAQLPPLYAHFDRPMPLIVPRARFEVVDATARRLLEQLGVEREALDLERDELLLKVAPPSSGPAPDALLDSLTSGLREPLKSFGVFAESMDAGLGKMVGKTEETVFGAIERLVDRYKRTLARNDEVTIGRLDRLLNRLRPEGAPQERVLSWASFGARHSDFVSRVLDDVVAFSGDLRTLEL